MTIADPKGHATTQELEARIATQRQHLADTVDLLGHKLDVKEQARIRLRRIRPEHIAIALGLCLAVVALVWWRRS